MKKYFIISLGGFLLCFSKPVNAQDTLNRITDTVQFSGQLSVWGHYNHSSPLPVSLGGRYIPAVYYGLIFPKNHILDFETSLNVFGSIGSRPFDSIRSSGDVAPYRAWARYSSRQMEIRLGLQKINFGSATLLRPLMWFDQVDPRDPLKITNGVWGLLGRYYFLNNANLWLWCLAGNHKARPWDIGSTHKNTPELGARFQTPVPKGELGITYHFREADTRNAGSAIPAFEEIPEHRIGLDGKWDLGAGLWFEGAWIQKEINLGILTNQEILNIGTDYTFNIGNGLNVIFEQLLVASDEYAFTFSNNLSLSGFSAGYPLGIVDHLNVIVYYDWKNRNAYNFINWNHTFKDLSLYLMAYLNPEQYQLPQQGYSDDSYAGPGIQIMLVYHH